MGTSSRFYYLDHLRVALTILVIAHHASQAYAPSGGAWLIANPTYSAILAPFQAVNAAFFMGLFFLISGYFVPGAYDRKSAGDRKGAWAFLKTRLIRLGLPTFLIALFVVGPFVYFGMPEGLSLDRYVSHLYQGGWRDLYGHLWFLLHLLLFNCGYVLWRLITKRINFQLRMDQNIPWYTVLLVFALILSLVTWIVRFRYSINQWVPFLYLVPAEMAHLPQYINMFVLGILAHRFNALDRIPTAVGMVWLGIGAVFTVGFYVDFLFIKRIIWPLPQSGMNLGSLIWSTWEALVCVGLGSGLLVVFREWINRVADRWMSAIIRAQYGAYIIHVLIVIAFQAGIISLSLPPFIKFGIVTIAGTILSFGFSHLILLKIPVVRKVI